MKKVITLFVVLLASANISNIQAQNFEQAKQIIQQANDVALATKSISYTYTYKGHGKYTGHFKGKVRLQGNYPDASTYIVLDALNEKGNVLSTEEIATAGMKIQAIDHSSKTFKHGTLTGGSVHLSSYSYYAALYQYISPMPFQGELKDASLKYEGKEEVNGIACHIISTTNGFQDRLFWYIGIDDHLIHANKSVHDDPDEGGGFYFEVSNIKVDKSIPAKDLTISVPDHYKRIDEDKREIKAGITAPGWFLKNLEGQSRRTLDYKGQVVVLDFWASWCKPCWQIMPIMNEIQTTYKENEVKVFGINVWEKKGLDIKAYLKEKGLDHYETLLDDEARTAKKYKVFSLPVLVVIGKDGEISFISKSVGASLSDLKKELEAAIKAAIQE